MSSRRLSSKTSTHLNALCSQIVDCAHSTPTWTESGQIVLRSQNIRNGRLNLSHPSFTTEEQYQSRGRRAELTAGDIVITREAPMGEVCMIPEGLRACLGQRMVLLRPDTKRVVGRYLLYALQSPIVQREILMNEGTGATVSNLRIPVLSALSIPTPPLSEQCAIALILGALDDKIELNRKMSATLQAVARALFKSWFVDFDPVRAKADSRDPGLPAEIAALFPDSFEETARGAIPSGWRVGGLGEVAKNKRNGISHNDITEGTPYIGLEHMPRRSIALDRWGHAFQLESNKSEFQQGNMLFGKLRPYFHKVGIAPVDGVCSTDILVVSATSAEWSAFVLMHLSSDALVAHTDRCSTGTKMPRASWDHICSYKVGLPPIEIARMFTAAVVPMTDRIIAGIHESRTLAALRDTLLPKLISGELRVTDAKRILAALA